MLTKEIFLLTDREVIQVKLLKLTTLMLEFPEAVTAYVRQEILLMQGYRGAGNVTYIGNPKGRCKSLRNQDM